jgi:rfaE bifunctional protein kinase chain/domain
MVSGKNPSNHEKLLRIVEGFLERRIVVLADVVVDEFVYGDIKRISREAPVLILEHSHVATVPGGGGNSAANLRALEALPVPVGVIGEDEAGGRLRREFKRRGIDTSRMVAERSYRTPCKSRILAGGVHTRRQQIVRLDRSPASAELPARTRSALRRTLGEALAGAEAVLVADYGYGSAAPEILASVGARLQRRNIPVIVDSRRRLREFQNVTARTPNQEELEQALGLEPLEDGAVEEAGRKLLRKCGDAALLVTRGAKGMLLLPRGRRSLAIPAYGSGEVADVTGAGDTVTAVFTLAIASGADFSEAALLANYAAGLVVTKAGTATISRQELVRAVREDC